MDETLRILVVDDEPGMREGVARALRDFTVSAAGVNGQYSLVVEQAGSAADAIARLLPASPASNEPAIDILLLDQILPDMTGMDVLEKIAGKIPSVATIMITAYASLETAIAAIKRGAYDFLAKPFNPYELKNAVRKAAESVILAKQARALATEKQQVRFQFISVLAHELKAPLAAVEGYLHIIKDRSAGDDQAAYDHMLSRSLIRVEGMRKLIGDLLDLTRIESGTKKREPAEQNLTELARTSVETMLPDAMARNITIELDIPHPIALLADRSEIEIIFNNLISNAVKYNRDGGKVVVAVVRRDDVVEIKVSDTGIGMTAEESARLFHDFMRIKNEKTRNIVGSGLGLSIVKKLAALYGGDVTLQSRPDVGSEFTVTLRGAER
ncbi:MAG: hybrid sensor histidine kinase/response regulator [Planctomycetaceae bacterium]|nr:MAG: hybrid sensor histidine kinase/response regulator [Planctomycetaceae bacterium]